MNKNMVSRSLYTSALALMMVGVTNFGDIPINTLANNNVIIESMQEVGDKNLMQVLNSSLITSYAAEPGVWEQQSTGEWKYKENGCYAIGWRYVNEKWYYMYDSGVMASNCWISGLYYVGSDGAMYENSWTPDGYYVGSDGAWIIDFDDVDTDNAEIDSTSKTTAGASGNSGNTNWWEEHLGGPTHNEDGATDHDLSVKTN